jgi:chorismate mutase
VARRVCAVRGATSIPENSPEAIVAGTVELLAQMLERNGAESEDLVSVVFTSTADLNAEFPAAAARELGLLDVPLLCASEIAVPGSLEKCVRVLMHLYSERPRTALVHVYLREAQSLRTDLDQL